MMRKILFIRTRSTDSLANDVMAAQQALPDHEIQVIDLTSAEPDYRILLEEIFTADSVQVW
jgi:hypothetical protein